MKPKATCEDIEKIVEVLIKHRMKPDKDGLITIIINEPIDSNILLTLSPFYRDSVGGEVCSDEGLL